MSDYDLYYWSVPLRGQFVRAILAFAGKSWTERGDDAILQLMQGPVERMPVPFMGAPILVDHASGISIAQTPAIVLYLGETLNLLPTEPYLKAMAIKVMNDSNDVIDELTLSGGRQMWTKERWDEFTPRLRKWMSLWEDTGRRHHLSAQSGFLLGENKPGIADIVTNILWSPLIERFPTIGQILQEVAPNTFGLIHRMDALPPLKALAAKARKEYGETWCSGEIEASLRMVLEDEAKP
jgi:glutathione S-transferase